MSLVNVTPPAALAMLSGAAGTLPVRTNRGSSAATENTGKTGCVETPQLLSGRRQNVEKHRPHSEKCLVCSCQSYLFLKFHKSALHAILKKQTTKSQRSLNR